MSLNSTQSSLQSSAVSPSGGGGGLRICVLQPNYSTSSVDYQNYDPPRDLSHLMPSASFTNIFLNKLTTYKQLKELSKQKFDIYVNLCEGYLEWEVPSIDVIYTLELLNLPFTGPTSLLYDPPKELMKYVAYTEGVKTPNYALIDSDSNIEQECKHLQYPLFVKPAKAGDSLGVDDKSLVKNIEELKNKIASIIDEYSPLLVEEYIDGREFTVMLAANADGKTVKIFKPVEYIFPSGNQFKTYALKTSELHPNANIPCNDENLEAQLREAASKIFKTFGGVGYARLDFRMNDKNEIFFLEINFTCSVFYKDGYEGSADYILKYDGFGQANFLQHIIQEGISRHKGKQKKYIMKGNSIAGYGIYATQNIAAGEVIFKGEEMAQRIVTKRFVEQNWDINEKLIFGKYAYPLSNEVYLLWDNNPAEWAPQNHSCNANTGYKGLNVIALTPINKGNELTLNYASFLDDTMEPFNCQCGAPNCSGFITGVKNNSVTERESKATD
ncbi:MAG: SET domain-containing protein-lysine N-methyltransferase [Ferruginibacter sp.]|nr:SET domain-containing protein-lysine N-methyltransferase [Ferruginibacter sp.]